MFKYFKKKFLKAWSIGLYTGSSPFHLIEYKKNPIISASKIYNIPTYFIADPFFISHKKTHYVFFELLNAITGQGEIGVASSNDYVNWKFCKTVLREHFHLSYPLVFKWNNDYYMIPESMHANSIRIYRAVNFPYDWEYVSDILKNKPYRDSTIFHHDNIWWLFTTFDDKTLYLYYTYNIISNNWQSHPMNPIKTGRYARPGGRIIIYNNRIIRFCQDTYPEYGSRIVAVEISTISTINYKEKLLEPVPFITPSGKGWNKDRIHHIDCQQLNNGKWIALVDGYSEELNTSIKVAGIRIYQKTLGKLFSKTLDN
jgi:hypothetical protein